MTALLTPEQIAAHLKEHPAQNDNTPRPPADAEGMKTGSSLSGAGTVPADWMRGRS